MATGFIKITTPKWEVAVGGPSSYRLFVMTALIVVICYSSLFSINADCEKNEFTPIANDGYPDDLHEDAFLARVSYRSGMLLSLHELAGLVHFPDASMTLRRWSDSSTTPKSCRRKLKSIS